MNRKNNPSDAGRRSEIPPHNGVNLGGMNVNGANLYREKHSGAGNCATSATPQTNDTVAGTVEPVATGHASRLPRLADCIVNGILAVAACYFLAHLLLWMVQL